jgi:indole-3-glycerol phosphate synthase
MEDFLDRLVQNAFGLVDSHYYDTLNDIVVNPRSLRKALEDCLHFPIIAEVKLSSPSLGQLTKRSPESLVNEYAEAGTAAFSVLTEPNFFNGHLSHVPLVASKGFPVLMKDIVVSARQIRAASEMGASGVLLIQSVFSRRMLAEDRDSLINEAHDLGLEVLLESTDLLELEEAVESEADLLGVNQRNLSDLSIDRSKGESILRVGVDTAGRPLVIMSGIETREEVIRLRDAGADAVLIGTSLSRSEHPGATLRNMVVPR